MNEANYHRTIRERHLQEQADRLFAACLHWVISKDRYALETIRNLSQELLDAGYESTFEKRKRALFVRRMFAKLEELAPTADQLGPRLEDVKELPDAS